MKASRLSAALVAIALVVAGVMIISAQEPNASIGTWELNLAKSKYTTGAVPKSQTITREVVAGGFIKETVHTVPVQGEPNHTEVTLKFDGKDYPVVGSRSVNPVRAIRRIDARTTESIQKDDGKPGVPVLTVVSADGKTMTVTQKGTTSTGQAVDVVRVLDRQ